MARRRRRRREIGATDEERLDHKGRRAIMWGAGTLLIGFFVGAVVSFIPIATGFRMPYQAASFDYIVAISALAVSLVGLGLLVYGMVELARARRHHHERPA